MNLDKQIELIKLISLFDTSKQMTIDGDSDYFISYIKYGNTQILNLARSGFREIEIIELDGKDILRYRFDKNKYEIGNIASILRDYEELDMSQFILIHGKDPFKWNKYIYPNLVLELLENDRELG